MPYALTLKVADVSKKIDFTKSDGFKNKNVLKKILQDKIEGFTYRLHLLKSFFFEK